MWQNLTEWTHGYVWGFCSFPVAYYVIKNFGAVLWQDIKQVAYKSWDWIKSKF